MAKSKTAALRAAKANAVRAFAPKLAAIRSGWMWAALSVDDPRVGEVLEQLGRSEILAFTLAQDVASGRVALDLPDEPRPLFDRPEATPEATPEAAPIVDSSGNMVPPTRACCGRGEANDPKRTNCERCGVVLPQTHGEHYIGIALLPIPVGDADPAAADEFYRELPMRKRQEEYNRRFGNPDRPKARGAADHPEPEPPMAPPGPVKLPKRGPPKKNFKVLYRYSDSLDPMLVEELKSPSFEQARARLPSICKFESIRLPDGNTVKIDHDRLELVQVAAKPRPKEEAAGA